MKLPKPSFTEEKKLRAQGYRLIAGLDEAGRGCLAGPVVAGAVILPDKLKAPWLKEVRDSKLLSPKKRDILFDRIREVAIATSTGVIDQRIIDTQGIAKATRLAMKAAVAQLSPAPETLLIDYFRLPEVSLHQQGIPEGDSLCFSIACASIIAKVTRDRLMVNFDKTYPGYGLAQHKGYGTPGHLACLERLGPSPIHRRTFQPVMDVIQEK